MRLLSQGWTETSTEPLPSGVVRPRKPKRWGVTAIVAANVVVWLAWFGSGMVPGLDELLFQNFVVNWQRLAAGRVWVLLTAVFSHIELWHLMFNMLALASFGRLFESIWGTPRFLRVYLAAGVVSSVAHCALSLFGWADVPALGASGAVSAVIILFSLLFPKEKILLFGIVPLPAWFASAGFVLWDLWGLIGQRRGEGLPIGHGAHLGGAAFGLAYWFFVVRREIAAARARSRFEAPGFPPAP